MPCTRPRCIAPGARTSSTRYVPNVPAVGPGPLVHRPCSSISGSTIATSYSNAKPCACLMLLAALLLQALSSSKVYLVVEKTQGTGLWPVSSGCTHVDGVATGTVAVAASIADTIAVLLVLVTILLIVLLILILKLNICLGWG